MPVDVSPLIRPEVLKPLLAAFPLPVRAEESGTATGVGFAVGSLGGDEPRFAAVVEGKGPLDPQERPYAGRKRSAVEQAYNYAINLP